MAKNVRESLSLKKLASIPPVLPIISDHPLDALSAAQDKFDLCYRLGPIFDIIRHPKTAMPTTIAIYGDWGAGKTSAMRWLEALIKEWNDQPDGPDKTTVHPVWFYPWKYHDKEDVWRGLISEVILSSINIKGADLPRIEKAAKQFGLFLGRSFLHVLSAVNEKAGSAVQKTIEEFKRVDHPENAYLNEFESSLKEWTDETLGKNDRMVIFIDDLDRCLPEIALQVLEALKLYLNIKKLIFVVGLDKDVIEKLVKDHYKNLGLDDSKSEKYLAKMFQTEVTVGPSEKQVTDYLDEQLDQIEYFKGDYLDVSEKILFRNLINKFADRNPREVKRLINSAVMAGAGAEMLKTAGHIQTSISFKQGLQVFFIRKIVENPKTYNMSRLVGSNDGNDFFAEWSRIVCENRSKDSKFPCFFKVPEDYKKEPISPEEKATSRLDDIFSSFTPEPYHGLLKERRFLPYLHLLEVEDLGQLMQIEFSTEIAEISQKVEPQQQSDDEIIRDVIAKQLNKKPDELRPENFENVKELDLAGRGITDISFLNILTNLTKLDLGGNQISDINPLKGLTNLTRLTLWRNQISDISPLNMLTNLMELGLEVNLICNISPLKNLTNLTALFLGKNQISDINPLKSLTNLKLLSVRENQIRDINSLKGLPNLTLLILKKNIISDISPLEMLLNLTELHLKGNQINDIIVLNNLTKMKYLDIRDCPNITNEQVEELKKSLPNLKIER